MFDSGGVGGSERIGFCALPILEEQGGVGYGFVFWLRWFGWCWAREGVVVVRLDSLC